MTQQPPRLAKYLLRRFCHVTLLEEIEGDLDEQFFERVEMHGPLRARLFYFKETMHAILWSGKARHQPHQHKAISLIDSTRHFFKIAFRNLRYNKISSLINIAGLALSLTSFLLVYFYLFDELTFDSFHRDPHNTYRISKSYERHSDGAIEIDARAGGEWVLKLKDVMPDVEAVTRFSRFGFPGTVRSESEDKVFVEQQFFWADPNYSDIFSVSMVSGADPSKILSNPSNVILSATTAARYFGKRDPIGKTLVYSRDGMDFSLTVAGVMRDYPSNAHFHPEFIASNIALNPLWKRDGDDRVNNWYDSFTYSFFILRHGTNPAKALHALEGIFRNDMKENENSSMKPVLTRLTDIHFTNGMLIELEGSGDKTYIFIFASIGILILLIAAINYMNLATARSIKRAKEVGLRKTLGVRRSSLAMQFLGESFLMVAISFVCSIVALILVMPFFNEMTGKAFTVFEADKIYGWMIVSGVLFILAIIAGSYPAFYLSRFKASEVLKGNVVIHGGAENFRKALVVFQFSITLLLIISTVVIHNQMSLARNTKLAKHENQVVSIQSAGLIDVSKVEVFRQLIMGDGTVKQVSTSSHFPIQENFGWSQHPIVVPEVGDDEHIWHEFTCDGECLSMFEIELVAGRHFIPGNYADSSSYLINETALKDLGVEAEQAVGLKVESKFGETQFNKAGTIVGVIKDFNFKSVKHAIAPMILNAQVKSAYVINVRLEGSDYEAGVGTIEKAWKKVFPQAPFNFWFMSNEFERLYRAEMQMQRISNYFAGFTVFIACLGMFGLASFTAEQKTKEIGIRKVLGASVGQILAMLTNRFVRLILIAYVIAVPVTLFALKSWLENFAYKVQPDWATFAGAGLLILVLTYLTVGAVSARAALENPADVIRHE